MIYKLFILVILSSCSSFSWKDFFTGNNNAAKRNEKLMEDFEVDKDLKEKFQIKPAPVVTKPIDPEKPTTSPQVKPVKMKPTNQRQAIRVKPLVRLIKPKPINLDKSVETKVESKIVDFEYPKKFPMKLKELDKDSEKYWPLFKPVLFPGEKMVLNITYMGINTGKITIRTKENSQIGSDNVFHLNARIKTSNYYSYLYEVDDFCDSLVRVKDFLPRKFSLIQRQSSQNIDDLQLFDLEKLTVISLYKRETEDKTKKKKRVKPIPRFFQDPLSILYFIRGLPLDEEATFSIPVANAGKVEEMIIKTGRQETIKTELGTKLAHVLDIETKHSGKTIKGGEMTFWFSADEKRIFLKFEAEIKIGSVKGEIEQYDS